jgi:lysophospholipase L1-like esterase
MLLKPVTIVLTTLLLFTVPSSPQTAYLLPKPAPLPSPPTLPAGEKQFLAYGGNAPGVRIWAPPAKGSMWHYGTTQSVGDGAGMYVYAPAGETTSYLCAYDTGVRKEEFKEYKGISFWMKGDGSPGTAVIATGDGSLPNKFRIPLKNTQWHKVFMTWDAWDKPITGPFWFLSFGLERREQKHSNWYIIDRVHLFKELKSEEINPTPDIDPPGLLPARAFVSGRQHINKTVAKLQAKKPVKIVIAGDSIVSGTQLWYTGNKDSRDFFFNLLGASLKKHYGYADMASLLRSYDKKNRLWTDKPEHRPVADLSIVAVAISGGGAKEGMENIDELLREKPDLVIWEYGCNDVTYSNIKLFLEPTIRAVHKLREQGIEVILQTITPGATITPVSYMNNRSPIEKGKTYNAELRTIASKNGCALADMERAFLARGDQFTGDLYADLVHPNHRGHEMLSDVLDALITDRDLRIWNQGPAVNSRRM